MFSSRSFIVSGLTFRSLIHKKYGTLHEFACHPCAGAMLIFSVSFQFFSICAAEASTTVDFINLNLDEHQDLRWKCCSPKFYLNVLIVETFLLYLEYFILCITIQIVCMENKTERIFWNEYANLNK